MPATFIIRLSDSSIAISLFSYYPPLSFSIIIISYIFKFVKGKAPHASHSQKAAQKVLEVEWFPTLPILRGAPKLFYYCLHMEFQDLGCAYEGHFCEQKNRIWGCVGLVGRCPVVSAPPLYHTFIKLSSTSYKE